MNTHPQNALSFYSIESKHYDLILEWFEKKHVRKYYYGQGLENTLGNLELSMRGINNNGSYSFHHWIAYIGEKPFGFLMTTPVEGPYDPDDDTNKWFEEGKKAITLDLFIGEEDFLGKGLAVRMIREFLKKMFPHVSKVLIDPAVSNAKAIHVYEKAGFKKLEQFIPEYNPTPHWMMCLDMVEDL